MQAKKNVATLFDRLTAMNATEVDSGISASQLKAYVIRDLLYLLNTTSYYYQADNTAEYTNSVINYGIEPISGRQVSEINWLNVENNIKLAIKLGIMNIVFFNPFYDSVFNRVKDKKANNNEQEYS